MGFANVCPHKAAERCLSGAWPKAASALPSKPTKNRGVAAKQTLPKRRRLRKRKEFLHTQSEGRKLRSGCLVGLITKNHLGFCRLGLTVTKKVCNAVGRNKIRRQLRELFRKNAKAKALSVDWVIVAVPGALESNLKEDFARLVAKTRVFVLRASP